MKAETCCRLVIKLCLPMEQSPASLECSSSAIHKFPSSCGTRSFNTVSKTARKLYITWAISIHSMLPSYFLTIRFNIIPHKPRFFQLVSVPQVITPKSCTHLCSTPYLTHVPSIYHYHPRNVWWGVLIMKLFIMLSSPVLCYIFLNILLANNLSLCSCLNLRDKSNVYWTVHHCNSWRMKDQLDVTCYFISLLMCSTSFGH